MTEAEVTDLIAQYGIKAVQDAIIVTMEMKRGTHLQKRGWSITATGKRPRWHCQDCGAWMTGKHSKQTDIK